MTSDLDQVVPGQQREPDVLHQGGHVLQAGRLVVLDPRDHRFKYLRDRCGGDQSFARTQGSTLRALVSEAFKKNKTSL